MSNRNRLSILYVAYSLLAVTEKSAGGAEQMLLAIEREMVAKGHRTTVAAADGSRVCGELLATGQPAGAPDQYEAREREHKTRILAYLREHPREFDLIHDKSGSFFRHAAEWPIPVLATLHLPRSFYPAGVFSTQVNGQNQAANPSASSRQALGRRHLFFNCVSGEQARSFADLPNLVGIVQNGVALEQFPFTRDKGDYLLWLGRICEEKAPHLAVAVAQQAGLPLVVAGQVYPFSYHQTYFDRQLRPHLNGGSRVQFVDTPTHSEKLELLRHARALLLTSTVEETSSLVAMEAMACGTPVVAFRRGAFPEVVVNGETGILVDTAEEMVAALDRAGEISPYTCRTRVERHFSTSRMAHEYEELYRIALTSAKEWAA